MKIELMLFAKYISLLVFFISSFFMRAQVSPIAQGHSHNDYDRENPLFDALDAGMTSIEIDIILVNGIIIVAHDEEEFDAANTIDKIYFKPISKLIKKRGGALYSEKSRRQIQLLIDLKTKGEEILHALDTEVQNYKLLFDRRGLDKKWSPLQIVLSGEVDKDLILGSRKYKYFHVDGRCPDVKKKYASYEMPLISEKYTKHFKWVGEGEPKKKEVKKLKKLIKKIQSQGKKLRFWATPDNEEVWAYLLDQGVDYINVDDLDRFQKYMSTR
tara:strand:+ start:635 stop:1447 length:813 start_codon:yes stop_codon:yes gene_type:complete